MDQKWSEIDEHRVPKRRLLDVGAGSFLSTFVLPESVEQSQPDPAGSLFESILKLEMACRGLNHAGETLFVCAVPCRQAIFKCRA